MKLRKYIKSIIPKSYHLPVQYNYSRFMGLLDKEIFMIGKHVNKKRRAIDIGANMGIYSYYLSKHFRNVESFEPLENCTILLNKYASRIGNLKLYTVGLSNKNEKAFLYVPIIGEGHLLNAGLASIHDPGGQRKQIEVPLHRLDDYGFKEVDFIKIDVEGHEYEVLEGAIETISREKPVLLIEIEQRHLGKKSIEDVIHYILSFGYKGGFYLNSTFTSTEEFNYKRDQKIFLENVSNNRYINNFFFTPL